MKMKNPSDDMRFLRSFLSNPLKVASPVPSGPKLARAIAREIDPRPGGVVLELGPGTGAVTAAILEHGIAPDELVAIETDPDFVALLRERFAQVHIVPGDAFDFRGVLDAAGYHEKLRSIVSGVPVLSQTREVRERLLRDAMASLRDGAPFIQFSYGVEPPIAPVSGTSVRRAAVVWQNLPPMHIWVYRGEIP